jgi:uncharacterized YccA/Bax inhibitor family protein
VASAGTIAAGISRSRDLPIEERATVQSSNPVLTRLGETAQRERQSQYAQPPAGYGQPPAGSPDYRDYPPIYAPSPVQPTGSGGYGVIAPADERAMTLDDVVVRTVALVTLTGVAGAFSWIFLRSGAWLGIALFGSVFAGLALGLAISFMRITNPLVISAYAVLQGILLGVASREFESVYPGIVVQAVAATFGIFLAMAVLYKFRVLRATPKFTRFVIGALIGVVALSLMNYLFSIFGHNLGYEYYGPTEKAGGLAILFAVVCIIVGALTFILDFDAVEQGIRYGLPHRFAWYCAFGMLVGLIYLYWQILRLLGYLRR